jgi:hypothetical protein
MARAEIEDLGTVEITIKPGLGAVEMLKHVARQLEERPSGVVVPVSQEAVLVRRCADALEAQDRADREVGS